MKGRSAQTFLEKPYDKENRTGLIETLRAIDEGGATIREALFTTDKDGAHAPNTTFYGMD